MLRGHWVDRRRVLAAGAAAGWPVAAAAATDPMSADALPFDVGLFGELSDLAEADQDPLTMTAALRALLWSVAPDDREALIRSTMFQGLNREALAMLAAQPDLGSLAEPLVRFDRSDRSAPQYRTYSPYILAREERPFIIYPDGQRKTLIINLRAMAMADVADRRTPVVEVSLRQGRGSSAAVPLRSRQLSLLQSGPWAVADEPFELRVVSRCSVTLRVTYVCIQGARA